MESDLFALDLKTLRQQILDDVQVCRKCRMSVNTCPTFEGWFTQSAMGRLIAINLHLKYGLGNEKELSDLTYACTSCLRCRQRCRNASMGVSPADIILKTRTYLVRKAREQEREKE